MPARGPPLEACRAAHRELPGPGGTRPSPTKNGRCASSRWGSGRRSIWRLSIRQAAETSSA